MLTGKEHLLYKFLESCPICNRPYNEHWKVVNHLRKHKDADHKAYLVKQEQEYIEVYQTTERQNLHKALFEQHNVFCGTSFAHSSKILHRLTDKKDREQNRRQRISKTMSITIKTSEHNSRVSIGVSKAWQQGKFDTDEVKAARAIGYKNRPSVKGENNPMFGKPCPKGAGRGKGGIREDIGHYVRSTWEANICRICIYVGRKYTYEPTRFPITIDSNQYSYCPDLYFPDKGFYYEIKGHARSSALWICDCIHCVKNRKIISQVRQTYGVKIIIIGRDEYKRLMRKFSKLVSTWERK